MKKRGDCMKTCTIFYILFIIHFMVFGLTMIYNSDLKHLESLLDRKQLEIYDKIKKERLNHFYCGLGAGGFLGLGVILSNMKLTSRFCLAGIVLIFSTVMIYYILPKSEYMVKHLKTEDQRLAWMSVHRNFMKKKIAGFLAVIILYFCIPFFLK